MERDTNLFFFFLPLLKSVVTQFSESQIYQFFVQDGKKIDMPETTVEGVSGNKLDEAFCKDQFAAFGDRDRFNEVGGWSKMNEALESGWVLVMSLWDDVSVLFLFH